MAASNRILLPLLVFLLARPQPLPLLGTTNVAAADTTADNGSNGDQLVRVSAWVQKQLGGDPDDGRVVDVEWDPRTEDVDAVARAFVRQTFSVGAGGDETGELATAQMAAALRQQATEQRQQRIEQRRKQQQQQQQQHQQEGAGSDDPLLPPPLPEALRLASLRRPTVDAPHFQLPHGLGGGHGHGHAAGSGAAAASSSPTVISLYAGHDASIAVGRGGKILCVLELERLFEKRYYESPDDGTQFTRDWHEALRTVRDRCGPEPCPLRFDYGVFIPLSTEAFPQKAIQMLLPRLVEDYFHVETWRTVDHHEAHARAGFFASPFRSALIVSYDGGGNDGAFNIYHGEFDRVQRLTRLDLNLGQMFNYVASQLSEVSGKEANCSIGRARERPGLEVDLSRAGKLMGYAALGTARSDLGIRNLYLKSGRLFGPGKLVVHESGDVELMNPDVVASAAFTRAVCGLEGLQGQRDVAATAQKDLQDLVLEIIESFLALHRSDLGAEAEARVLGEGIVLTGGCALNVPTNQLVYDRFQAPPPSSRSGESGGGSGSGSESGGNSDYSHQSQHHNHHHHREVGVFVPPAPSDCGLTVGGVFAVTPPPTRPQGLQYAGFAIWDLESLEGEAARRGAVRLSEIGGVDFLARLLCREDRPIVAVMRGRQEHGPRALGHRSLLAVPDASDIKARLNRLKGREFYRPVAPMIATEALGAVFGVRHAVESPFMSMAPPVLPEVRERFPGLAHVDGTARHQSVSRSDEPWLHALLHAVAARAGLAALINTSFNAKGKPICNTVKGALEMLDTLPDLRFLLIEDWLFAKKGEEDDAVRRLFLETETETETTRALPDMRQRSNRRTQNERQ